MSELSEWFTNAKFTEMLDGDAEAAYYNKVAEIAALEAKLEAMERVLDEISELSHGQGIAAIYIAAKAIGKKLPDTGSLAAI